MCKHKTSLNINDTYIYIYNMFKHTKQCDQTHIMYHIKQNNKPINM